MILQQGYSKLSNNKSSSNANNLKNQGQIINNMKANYVGENVIPSSQMVGNDKTNDNYSIVNKSLDASKSRSIPAKNRNLYGSGGMKNVKGIGSSLVKSTAYNNSSVSNANSIGIQKQNNNFNHNNINKQEKPTKNAFGISNYSGIKKNTPNYNIYKMRVYSQNKISSRSIYTANSKNMENSKNLNNKPIIKISNNNNQERLRSSSNASNNSSLLGFGGKTNSGATTNSNNIAVARPSTGSNNKSTNNNNINSMDNLSNLNSNSGNISGGNNNNNSSNNNNNNSNIGNLINNNSSNKVNKGSYTVNNLNMRSYSPILSNKNRIYSQNKTPSRGIYKANSNNLLESSKSNRTNIINNNNVDIRINQNNFLNRSHNNVNNLNNLSSIRNNSKNSNNNHSFNVISNQVDSGSQSTNLSNRGQLNQNKSVSNVKTVKSSYGFGNFHVRNLSPNFKGYKMRGFGQNSKSTSKSNLSANSKNKNLDYSNSFNQSNSNNFNNFGRMRSNSKNSKDKGNFHNAFGIRQNNQSSLTGRSNISSASNNYSFKNIFPKSFNYNNNNHKSNIASKNQGKVHLEFVDDQTSEVKNQKENKNNGNQNNLGNNSNNMNNLLNNSSVVGINNKINNSSKPQGNSMVIGNSNNNNLKNSLEKDNINNNNILIEKSQNNDQKNQLLERSNKFVSSNNNFEGRSVKEIIKENDTSPFSHFHWKKIDNSKISSAKGKDNNNNDFSPTKYIGKNNFNVVKPMLNNKNFTNISGNNNIKRGNTPEKMIGGENKPLDNNNKDHLKKNINQMNSRISVLESSSIQGKVVNQPEEISSDSSNINKIGLVSVPATYSKKTLNSSLNNNQNNSNNENSGGLNKDVNQVYNKIKKNNTYSKSNNNNNVYQFQNNQEEKEFTNKGNTVYNNMNQNSNNNINTKIQSLEQPSGSTFVDELFNTPELKNLLSGGKTSYADNNKDIGLKLNQLNQSQNKVNNSIGVGVNDINTHQVNNNNESIKLSSSNPPSINNINNSNISLKGRKIKIFKEFTKTGYNGTETKKNNQDISIIYPNFNNQKDSYFFSVCDGHGIVGHEVSRYIKTYLPVNLENELKLKNLTMFSSDNKAINKSFEDMFNLTNINLNNSSVETEYSGSTCVSLVYSPQKILTANIGDSRAVMGKLIEGSKLFSFFLL